MTTSTTPTDLRSATDWAKVFHIVDHSLLPADGRLTSFDQLKTRPAAYWQDRWLPRFQGPDELIDAGEFGVRLAAALRGAPA